MIKILNSLQTKLILSFVLLIVVIAGGTFVFTYGQTKKALLDGIKEDLAQVIGMASTQVSPPDVASISRLKEGQDTDPAYLALRQKFQAMRALSPNVVNFYVLRLEGNQAVFLLDDVNPEDDPAAIGQEYLNPEAKLFEAQAGIQVSDEPYTDEWGTFLSAYAPVKDKDGQVAFILGADMLATTVIERQNFIGNTIYIVMGLAILIAAGIIGAFSMTIIKDIKKLNTVAEQISTGDTNVSVDVHRKDEIGELAASFERMVASLKIMMTPEDGQN